MRSRFRSLTLLGAALMVAGPLALAADATTVKTYARQRTYHVTTSVTVGSCGSKLLSMDLESGVTLATANFSFFFSNNAKLTHVADTTGDLSAVFHTSDSDRLQLGVAANGKTLPVGGNPWLFLVYDDGSGEQTLHYIGRCRGILGLPGGKAVDTTDILVDMIDTVGADVLECSNHPGPYLNIGAGTDGPGLATTILATNNKNKAQAWIDAQGPVNGFHYADADGYITLEPTGGAIRVRKGGPLQATSYNDNPWGPGGNPHIWVFPTEDLNGTMPTLTIGGDGYMARCHDL